MGATGSVWSKSVENSWHKSQEDSKRQPFRIGLWGNFGTGNLGNECTLASTIQNVTQYVADAQLLCICSEPEDAGPRHGIEAVRIRMAPTEGRQLPTILRKVRRVAIEIRDFIRAVVVAKELDKLLITGTGILSDAGEGHFGMPYQLFKWSLATKLAGAKVMFLSVGVEEVNSVLAKAFVKGALRLAEYRSYRDCQSRDRMQAIGLSVDNDVVYPDLAFSLSESMPSHSRPRTSAKLVVGVGLYSYMGRGAAGEEDLAKYNAYLDIVCSFITWLLVREYDVRIIIGDLMYDDEVRHDVRERLRQTGTVLDSHKYVDEPATSFEDLLEQLTLVDFLVATRFHSVLLALLAGRPVVSISYDAKNDVLMRDMGLGKYCQSLSRLNFDRLVEQFMDLEKNAAQLIPAMQLKAAEFRSKLDEQYRIVLGGARQSI